MQAACDAVALSTPEADNHLSQQPRWSWRRGQAEARHFDQQRLAVRGRPPRAADFNSECEEQERHAGATGYKTIGHRLAKIDEAFG
jgi:hypothetical protein